MKILPGKMAEAVELLEKQSAVVKRLGAAPWKSYRCFSGGRDTMHTIVFHAEWESLATMEASFEKAFADPEMQELLSKWETLCESDEVELYTPLAY